MWYDHYMSIPETPIPLRDLVFPTTIIHAPRLCERVGVDFSIASETFQLTGSFKFRAAYNVALNVSNPAVITASSGNFGQAMALACYLTGKACTVVMPNTSVQVKVDAVREYGATADLIDVNTMSRADRVAALAREHPEAYVASAYDDPFVIEGNSTLGEELVASGMEMGAVIAPLGGGGLTAGLVTGLRQSGSDMQVYGAEPLLANDGARSLREGRLVQNDGEPQTIADGARTVSLGNRNWDILKSGLAGIVEVPEEKIREAVRLLFSLANLKVEPTGALAVAALLADTERFRGHSVLCVVSGGNVDPGVYCDLIA
jgi:threonine dehydratase